MLLNAKEVETHALSLKHVYSMHYNESKSHQLQDMQIWTKLFKNPKLVAQLNFNKTYIRRAFLYFLLWKKQSKQPYNS